MRILPIAVAVEAVARFTVSPGERFLVYGRDDGTGSDLMLADSFR